MELKPETKHDFSNHAEILQVLKEVHEKKISHDIAIMAPIRKGIKEFLKTRTNSELVDLADLDPSIWDDYDEVVKPWETECDRRSFPMESEFRNTMKKLSEYYSDEESLEFKFGKVQIQVEGMQKKVDRMSKILGKKKFTLRFKDLLGL